MNENCDPFDLLLLAASKELEETQVQPKTLTETNLFQQETNVPKQSHATVPKNSVLHSGDTDSSDDEDSRNWEERKYTEHGREIKRILDTASSSSTIIRSVGSDSKRLSHVSNWNKPVAPLDKKRILSKLNPGKDIKSQPESTIKIDVYTDPVFGLRIINPLISSSVLQDRMVGREAITFSKLNRFLQIKTKDTDWVLAGVVINKTAPKTSQKGTQFSIWTMSDLKDDIKTVAVFLFSGAHQDLWKTTIGSVVGLLNPNVLEKKDGKDEANLSIDNSHKVMVFGQSKDFGTCKSLKKNGDKCTAVVNKSRCEFCIYHIKQEYQKCTIRSDLQSTFGGRGLTALRNKVLGKNEVFYAGKSYTAIPAKKNRKLEQKDNNRLNGLLGKGSTPKRIINSEVKKKSAPVLEVSRAQKINDLKLLEKLNGSLDLAKKTSFEGKQSVDITLEEAKNLATTVLSKLKAKTQNSENLTNISEISTNLDNNKSDHSSEISLDDAKNLATSVLDKLKSKNNQNSSSVEVQKHSSNNLKNKQTTEETIKNKLTEKKVVSNIRTNLQFSGPKLSGFDSGLVDLNKPITPRRIEKAKLNAINLIKKNGPIKKVDPNNLRGTGIKRPLEVDGEIHESSTKKVKEVANSFTSERFKKIMAATSNHQDLLEAREEEEKNKYFLKLEAKEKMEEKMITTHKVACKAVKCLQCKYTSFSASDLCKSERHTLKKFDAFKRFYKCGHCQHRTVSLDLIPLKGCNNCGSSKWEKTGMMKEKLVTASHSLSIRGGEQKHLNSVITDTNVDLLVPD